MEKNSNKKLEKKVSIIVPVYNCEKYLEDCLDSIVNQTYSNLEIFLVDDEAKDNSGVICDKYASKDDRITVIHQVNAGCGFARNTALELMTGDYYTFIDSDDYVSIHMIEKMVHVIELYKADLVEVGRVLMLETRNVRKNCDGSIKFCEADEFGDIPGLIDTAWGRLFRSNIFRDVRFDRASYEDVPYGVMIRKRLRCAVRLNEALYVYRAYQDSITRGNFGKKSIDKLLSSYNELSDEKGYMSWLEKVKEVCTIIEYRGQEKYYSKEINKLDICMKNYTYKSSNDKTPDWFKKIKNSSECNIFIYYITKMKRLINVTLSWYKVKIKYKIKID